MIVPQRSFQHARSPTLEARRRYETRVYKRRNTASKNVKRRNGLLNTTICPRSDMMRIAQENSLKSPLLRLPGELRDMIWKLALGDHQIDIQDVRIEEPIQSIYDMRTVYPVTLCTPGFVRPTFQLPRVCRQIYTEAAPYVYTLNTFAFHTINTLDRWIKNRCVGQRRLIASVDIPRTYARLYRSGFRKTFRSKLPNISRIGIDSWTLFCGYDEMRRLPESKGRGALEMWVDAKARIIAEIKDKEGEDVCIEWHGQSA